MPEGPFIAMTSKVPKKIGYFNENLIYGYEHTYYTLNCLKENLIPFNLDVVDTKIELNENAQGPYTNSLMNSDKKAENITKSIEYIKSNKY